MLYQKDQTLEIEKFLQNQNTYEALQSLHRQGHEAGLSDCSLDMPSLQIDDSWRVPSITNIV